ncbi:MAG TPA: amidohydrolase family protein, partial [Acidimicrobiia bacterium]
HPRLGSVRTVREAAHVTTTAIKHRYAIISADGHCGANVEGYKPYLERKYHEQFDAWAAAFVNPYSDLASETAYRSWDSDRRQEELEADGVAGEVLFPNTVPPFFPSGNLLAPLPTADEYELRWAGVKAHNRWLADFCALVPGRRAGIAQIFLNDIDDALAEIRWTKDAGLNGGVLIPGIGPGCGLRPLFAKEYEPIWALCEELDLTINQHGGTGLPLDFDPLQPEDRAVLLVEIPIFGHRGMYHLMFGGAFERHPSLRFVLTEQGTGWIPGALRSLDWFQRRMRIETAAEHQFGGEVAAKMSLTPTEYFARNCWVGASFIRPVEAALRHEIGIDRIMWGSDFPHSEGSYPYTTEALRASLADATEDEMRLMLGRTAADVYGFDFDALQTVADRIGPTVDEVAVPLPVHEWPTDTTCNAFDADAIVRSW